MYSVNIDGKSLNGHHAQKVAMEDKEAEMLHVYKQSMH